MKTEQRKKICPIMDDSFFCRCFFEITMNLFGIVMATMMTSSWREQSPYGDQYGPETTTTTTTTTDSSDNNISSTDIKYYPAKCYCGRVQYEVRGDPESTKLCHCRACQLLHGAPFEWVSIFHKQNVKFNPKSLNYLYFYSSELDQGWTSDHAKERSLPVKVSCSHCRTPIADEGRNMWLAFTTLFGFTVETGIPKQFQHTNHLFFSQRCIRLEEDDDDDSTTMKWIGHKNKSPLWTKPKSSSSSSQK